MEEPVPQSTAAKISMALIALVGWFGILVQYYIRTGSTANFLSYFTVQCNLFIAISLTVILLAPRSRLGRLFATASFQTALALYIVIVGIVYNTILRGLVLLSGMGLVVDTILHVVIPAAYYIYWFAFVPKGALAWKDSLPWLWYPAAYLVYSLIRGHFVNWYPYPFLNAFKFGYPQVMLNILGLILVFFVGAIIMIAIKRRPVRASGDSRFIR